MSVFEVTTTLSTARAKIVELEKELQTQKDNISIEFLKEVEEKEKLHKEEMEKVVQATKGELTSEFERIARATETLHTEELNKALQTQRDKIMQNLKRKYR
jgi:predicted  nucleic acid-binding Zn-ribbon protein